MVVKLVTTPTCIKCKGFKPTLEKFCAENNLKLLIINALDNMKIVEKFSISSVPFIIVENDEGSVINTYSGVPTENELLNLINKE